MGSLESAHCYGGAAGFSARESMMPMLRFAVAEPGSGFPLGFEGNAIEQTGLGGRIPEGRSGDFAP